LKDQVSVALRCYFSTQHIQSAALFARLAAKIEKAYAGVSSGELIAEHRGYVTASIFAAVAFLEATINELFADAQEVDHGQLKGLDPAVVSLMTDMWKRQIPRTARYRVLEKFDIALVLARKEPFIPGLPPYQDIVLLVRLRNSLVHYEPEWMAAGLDPKYDNELDKDLAKALRGKFLASPLMSEGNPFYPDRCLSHGCAKWAVESSITFADTFFAKIGPKPTYDHVRARLSTY
jgi:hypothetical protein